MFCINEGGVAEWIVAKNRKQALKFYSELVGEDVIKETYEDVKQSDPDLTYKEFLEDYIREESPDKLFPLYLENGEKVTKTVREHLKDVLIVPNYFGCSDY